MRVGILTGGGDCPGLNAVIRAVVEIGIDCHGFEVLGIEDAFSGLIDLAYRSPDGNRWLTSRDVRGVLPRGGTILGTSNRSDPFRFPIENERGEAVETDVSGQVLANFRAMGLDALVAIGGDGTARIAKRFADLGLPLVVVPKTIDNDLDMTDQTFGFDTTIGIATEAIDRLRDTAASHDRVMIAEVMGRDAGWIALHAGLASGADAILLPEIPYRIEALVEMIAERKREGVVHSIVVISEGAKPVHGEASAMAAKAGEMPRYAGAGHRLAAELSARTRADVRVTVLGHVQRGGSPSSFDRILATRFGYAAVSLIAQRDFGKMVALRAGEVVAIPLASAVTSQKLVDPEGQLVRMARALGVVMG
jgi:ATP-dependent phosphofructokinase / diphosphate-dependent phosphofructokinase